MNTSDCVTGRGTLRDVDVLAACETLAGFLDHIGESHDPLDGLSPTERLDALVRAAIGSEFDVEVTFAPGRLADRFDVTVDAREPVKASAFETVLELVSIVAGPSELVMLGSEGTAWRYLVRDRTLMRQKGRLVFDGPMQDVGPVR
jgi:hypothetical protein